MPPIKVLTISIWNDMFDILKENLKDTFILKKFNLKNKNIINGKNCDLILMGCNHRCNLKPCLNKFIFLIQNKIPFMIVRHSFLKEKYKYLNTIFFTIYQDYNMDSINKNMYGQLNILKDHHLYSRKIHPSNTIYKILEIQKYLNENPQKREHLSSLATKIDFSPVWFSHKFKEISGISYEKYSLKIRFCHSLWEVLATHKLLKTIALEHGYKPLSFTKRFHSVFGVSPSEIRKNLSSFLT